MQSEEALKVRVDLVQSCKNATSLLIALVVVLASMQSQGQSTVHIRFEGPPPQPPGTSYYVQQYYESGMWFRPMGVVGPGNGFSRVGGGSPAFIPDNGTAYIRTGLGDSFLFSFVNGNAFDLRSVDLAEFSTGLSGAVTVPFIGYRQDGSMVTNSFTTDGIIDGTGPIADFQTFYFGPEFTVLDRVEIPTYAWSLDNLMVSIPEPGTWALLSLGGVLAGCRFWRRRLKY